VIQGALHHGLRHGSAVLGQDVLFQAAAVDADADGDILLLAGLHDGFHAVIVADVARVDANFIHAHVRTGQCSLVIKMDVRHDGDIDGIFDRLDALGIGGTGAGHPQDLAACCLTALGLGHIALNILHRNIQHGLHGDGVFAADGHIADLHFSFQLPHGLLPFVKSPR